ncbi:glycoside hydrolase [Mucilaginibacter glaciei]|uniref:Beta-glycosidase n=1 Tax=Mucilaginibacter glaciei TaxID=2772109 RepID=A0A926NMF1_9SPHI|nr:glycoside hydrolase [Mucilaginibacter glaciei]MBD1394784.1 beta-glycosidase [Mucilaginibacter glaciei]
MLHLLLLTFLTAFNNPKAPADTTIIVTINTGKRAQVIDNIGASGCWFSEGIGKYWPEQKREKIAQLLFSRKQDVKGNPEGIGLSAWRFNIGAGTAEKGDSSGIKDFRKRTESFLSKNGTYDWSKQAGYQFFLKKAHAYGVENLIAFVNSPPVQFTKNGLGFKLEKDYHSNLKPGAYDAYAEFLSNVIRHFDRKGLHFSYISPVNEPQWDWADKYMQAKQEGSPWKNDEIYQVVKTLDKSLTQNHLDTKILVTEAGMLNYLYSGSTGASAQIQQFFKPGSALYMGNLAHLPKIIGGHSYFSEGTDSNMVAVRSHLADTAKYYGVNYWQTEYSMLGDGYKDGNKGKRTAMDCALFLAKVIHNDLTIGNATAWQFWNSYEPGGADFDTRYYLIALNPKPDFKDGEFTVTKNLWALGHYSLFIRPGMQRVSVQTDVKQGLMFSAYIHPKTKKLVVVGINYGTSSVRIKLNLENTVKKYPASSVYLTTSDKAVNMQRLAGKINNANGFTLPARSIATLVAP